MKDEQEYSPEFSRPDKNAQGADQNADQAAYFAYWTLRHRMKQREREQSPGLYEDLWDMYYSQPKD